MTLVQQRAQQLNRNRVGRKRNHSRQSQNERARQPHGREIQDGG
jgi:hypothetical protein